MSNRITVGLPGRSKVNVITTPKNRVQVSNKGGGIGGGSGVDTLRELRDVDATDSDNNETVVYDTAAGKFVVKELPVINGGTF